jgi:hypothetical protein
MPCVCLPPDGGRSFVPQKKDDDYWRTRRTELARELIAAKHRELPAAPLAELYALIQEDLELMLLHERYGSNP